MQGSLGIIAVIVAALVSACGGAPQTSSTKHTLDQPVRHTAAWQWENTTTREYDRAIMPLIGMDGAQFAMPTSELQTRTQFWLDTIDDMLRRDHPEMLATVPRPQARVMIANTLNAFVAPVPVCYSVPLWFRSDRTPTRRTTTDGAYLDLKTGEVSLWPADQLDCAERRDRAALARIVASLNQAQNGCTFTLENTDRGEEVVARGNCDIAQDLSGDVYAESIAVLSTANFVTVHTGIMAGMSEEEFVAVIAHELGHYYRGHIMAPDSEYGFFYEMERRNHSERPVADSRLRRAGEAAVAAAGLLRSGDAVSQVEGSDLRAELFMATGSAVAAVCSDGTCSDVCQTAYETIQDAEPALGLFPFTELEDEDAYDTFAQASEQCLRDIDLSRAAQTLTPSAVSWDIFVTLTRQPLWPSWLGQISRSGQAFVARMSEQFANRLPANAPRTDNLWDAIIEASEGMATQDRAAVSALRSAYERRIGQYTGEQEADDLSAEWMADLGFDPYHAVESQQRLGGGLTDGMGGYLFGEATCDELLANDFYNEQGDYMFVPVGDYSEIHHSQCYRVFNLVREIEAHGLTPRGEAVRAPGPRWDRIRELAASMGSSDESIDGDAHSFAHNFWNHDCGFAPKLR